MSRQNINSSDTPNTGRTKINDNFTELYDEVEDGVVPETRQLNTTAPITGGGALSADRTIGHASSGVTPDTYANPASVTVNASGHITSITQGGDDVDGSIGPHELSEHTDFDQVTTPVTGDAVVYGTAYSQATLHEDFEDSTLFLPEDSGNDPGWARTTSQFYLGAYSFRSPTSAADYSGAYSTFNFVWTPPEGGIRNPTVSIRYKMLGAADDGQFFCYLQGNEVVSTPSSGGEDATWKTGTMSLEGLFIDDLFFTLQMVNFSLPSTVNIAYVDEIKITYEEYGPAWTPSKVASYVAPIHHVTTRDPNPLSGDSWIRSDTIPKQLRTRSGDSVYRADLRESSQIGEFSLANDPAPTGAADSIHYRGRQFTPLVTDMTLTGVRLRSITYEDGTVDGAGLVSVTTNSGTTVLATKRFFHDATSTWGEKVVYFDTPVPLAAGTIYEVGYGSPFNGGWLALADTGAGTSTADFTVGNSITATNEAGTTSRTTVTTSWPNAAFIYEKALPDTGGGTVDAYTITTASFTQPDVGSTTAVTVSQTAWVAVGQNVYVEGAGYYQATSITSTTIVQLRNLGYPDNVPSATLVASGKKVSPGGVRGAPASHRNLSTLAVDVTNNNSVANTLQDVTGLSFSALAGNTYRFEFKIAYDAAATTTGSRWSLSGPTASVLSYIVRYPSTTTTTEILQYQSTYNAGTVSTGSPATTNNYCSVEGIIRATASGTIILRFASEVSASAIVAKAGSTVEWWDMSSVGAGGGGVVTAADVSYAGAAGMSATNLEAAVDELSAEVLRKDEYQVAPVSISTNTTLDPTKDTYLVNCTSGAVTCTLPTAVGRAGDTFTLKKTDSSSNSLIIDAAGTETIDGSLTIDTATQNDAVSIVSDGANWRIITSPTGLVGLEERTSDPGSPFNGQQWLRSDLTPPEFKYRKGGVTYKLVFTT